jgi:hypothetical protein
MHDRFSQRDEAIRAAIHAHNNYHGECDRRRARGDTTWPQYWDYVVNAALDAVDEPRPVPPDESPTRSDVLDDALIALSTAIVALSLLWWVL